MENLFCNLSTSPHFLSSQGTSNDKKDFFPRPTTTPTQKSFPLNEFVSIDVKTGLRTYLNCTNV